MSVASDENKQMLIDLMDTIISENKLSMHKSVDIVKFISETCNYFHTKRFEFGNINEINKKIVELSYNHILANDIKKQVNTPVVEENISKREIFDNNLKQQENNFKKMIQPKKPKKIDFSDGSKDYPMDNLGMIMNQTLADRQKELKMITQQYSDSDKVKAQKWINPNGEKNSNTPKLNIDRTSNIDINPINVTKQQRKVRFDIEEKGASNIENFLLKLKKKPSEKTNNDNMMVEKLDLIIYNQNRIIDLLEKRENSFLEMTPNDADNELKSI